MLSHEAVRRALADGVTIVDAREAEAFALGHPAGALCVPFSEKGFATRIHVADPSVASVVIVGADPGHRPGVSAQLSDAGIAFAGFAPADPDWWSDLDIAWRVLPERPLEALAERGVTVVDVREPLEWETGHAPGALLVPLGELHARVDEIPVAGDVILICEAGVRSATAASILLDAGRTNVSHAPLGTAGIRAGGGALEYPSTAPSETP